MPEKVRWIVKIAVSGASRYMLALETHIAKARKAGATEDEIKRALLLIIQTAGFPSFMEASSTYRRMTEDGQNGRWSELIDPTALVII